MTSTHRVTHISFPDMEETSYHDITSGIAEGSLLLDEILLTNGLNFGEVNSNRFEVQLYNISDVSGQKIVVWQEDLDTSTNIPLFTGYVDSCKQNHSGYYREIVAYDILYSKSTENIGNWWKDFWDFQIGSATLKSIRNGLLSHVGVSTGTVPTLPNDNLEISHLVYEPTLTFGALLSMICELQGTIPNINRSGLLEFIVLGTNYTDESSNINKGDSLFEEFTTNNIDAVWVYDSTHKVVGFGGSGSQNPYKIQGNILTVGVEDKNTMAAVIFQAINAITYIPGTIKYIVSNLDLKLGKRVYFGNGYTYLFENVLSGPILIEQESNSRGGQYLQEDLGWNSELASIETSLNNQLIQYYIFMNSAQITINDGEDEKIIDVRFTSNEKTVVILQAEILLDVETTVDDIEYNDAIITLKYKYNDAWLTEYQPKEQYLDGNHILHIFRYFTIQAARLDHLEVWLEVNGGNVTIPPACLRSCLYGQNLAASNTWDGTFEFRQQVTVFDLGHPAHGITMIEYGDTVVVEAQVPIGAGFTQEIGILNIGHPVHGIEMLDYYGELEVETNEV